VTPAQILLLAATMNRERPNQTSSQVRRIMSDNLGEAPSESTLLRLFRTFESQMGGGGVRPVRDGLPERVLGRRRPPRAEDQ